jgi:hypothetical protein
MEAVVQSQTNTSSKFVTITDKTPLINTPQSQTNIPYRYVTITDKKRHKRVYGRPSVGTYCHYPVESGGNIEIPV